VAVDVRNRSHVISVTVDVPEGVVPQGTLLALGCVLGGWSLHVLDGRLRYVHNLHGQRWYDITSDSTVGSGRHLLQLKFEKDELLGGEATLIQDDNEVGSGTIDRFTPVAFNEVGIGLTCGYEWGPAVGSGYTAPFAFNGTIVRAEVAATGPMVRDPVAEVAAILSMQ
jgi:arylsulfatase